MVSISPMTAPEASSRLISPASPEWLVTVMIWVPGSADVHSGTQLARVTVTPLAASAAGAGSVAMVAPAATAGTAISTPATSHGRPPATRSHRPGPRVVPGCPAPAGVAAGAAVLPAGTASAAAVSAGAVPDGGG